MGAKDNVIYPTISAMAYSYYLESPGSYARAPNDCSRFLMGQVEALSDFLVLPMKILIMIFNLYPLLKYQKTFCWLTQQQRQSVLAGWRKSKLGPMRDFVRFYETLAIFFLYSERPQAQIKKRAAA